MTHDQIHETVTDIEHAVLAQIDHNDITVDDHLTMAVMMEEAADRQLAQAERIERQGQQYQGVSR